MDNNHPGAKEAWLKADEVVRDWEDSFKTDPAKLLGDIGSFLVNFFSLPDVAGLTEATAGKYVAFYWGGAMIGRFVGSVIQTYIKPARWLAINVAAAIVMVAATMMLPGSLAMWTIISVGLFNSIMFPTIFTLSIDGLGRHTGQGSGILCMAIVGGAILPLLMGLIADASSIRTGFVVPLLGYAYILYYALAGYKHRQG